MLNAQNTESSISSTAFEGVVTERVSVFSFSVSSGSTSRKYDLPDKNHNPGSWILSTTAIESLMAIHLTGGYKEAAEDMYTVAARIVQNVMNSTFEVYFKNKQVISA
ncbi:hypothetical protein PHYBLDRAFT_150639 [Phycomyces blakesleeanus NRRL 1555(-)]|uniref:Uncharacterized protein n=1 Tax=Phycomyces blakesleeanus (strain ATCC 8743b / DSM 1359 / FGSC 10004 / NBRC 33097 / NRRL 1555) TaxID=763407 RepID=A0A162N4I2_PHYB8|nr:hypothetical protein PHYBLDRAFT_150639 [Phycomyces blakesleeanus NRRL 1555(-)]OAD68468.1 hypothetical protein PHYBLDRAFT_150639 [Phycomyces blakesleeanus NRRL 1555(-)]|eukprot:XP_018286508.1 hypothetical protein PHYBLDRAFT_150639 [Phycomyces blakesleeanus NRRL 1555(-)]